MSEKRRIQLTLTVEVNPMDWVAFNKNVLMPTSDDMADFAAEVLQETITFCETGATVISSRGWVLER